MSVALKRVQCILPSGARQTRFGEKPHYDEGLYEIAERTYAWLVPNGSWGESNSGLVVGEGESLLIDTLWDVPLTRAMLNASIGKQADCIAARDQQLYCPLRHHKQEYPV